jgi:hypothetical protein
VGQPAKSTILVKGVYVFAFILLVWDTCELANTKKKLKKNPKEFTINSGKKKLIYVVNI